jgi:hypothetical protein
MCFHPQLLCLSFFPCVKTNSHINFKTKIMPFDKKEREEMCIHISSNERHLKDNFYKDWNDFSS